MEKRDAEMSSLSSLIAEMGDAGGKFWKSLSWRPPTTPYARSSPNQAQGGRWLSKLVDPAFRLVAGATALTFPPFFSKLQSVNALPAPSGGVGWFLTKTPLSRLNFLIIVIDLA